jgi:uncharacterized membrane protein YhaH (DUF805 family)
MAEWSRDPSPTARRVNVAHSTDFITALGYGVADRALAKRFKKMGGSMSFAESVRTCFSKYVTWNGRAGRAEYWWFALFTLIVYVVGLIITAAVHSPIPVILLVLVFVLPAIAVTVRRLHDIGRSGWWYWISLIPLIGGIILLVFTCTGSQGPNQYGNGPDGANVGGAVTA